MTEKLNFPVEKFKKSDIFPDYAGGQVPVLVFIEVPVDVPPLIELHGLILLVSVSLSLPDAVEEDDLEAGDAEKGH